MLHGWKFAGWNTYGNISTWTDFPETNFKGFLLWQGF
jgi:hypothetical protein